MRSGDPVERHAIDVRDGQVCAFLGRQQHVATEYCGQIDPTDLDEYIRHDGFKALRHCLERLSPEEIIERGAGQRAAGPRRGRFPHRAEVGRGPPGAGRQEIRHLQRRRGRPGAFMDRMLLNRFPIA